MAGKQKKATFRIMKTVGQFITRMTQEFFFLVILPKNYCGNVQTSAIEGELLCASTESLFEQRATLFPRVHTDFHMQSHIHLGRVQVKIPDFHCIILLGNGSNSHFSSYNCLSLSLPLKD